MITTLPDADVTDVAAMVLGGRTDLAGWTTEEVAYESGSPATGGLLRVRGKATDGRDWSVFVKLLQHLRHWPRRDQVPAAFRDDFVRDFPWRQETCVWDPPFAARLPAGLRVPVLYRLTALDDDRLLVWMEDIDALDNTAWGPDQFRQAATALGGLAALSSRPEVIAASSQPRGYGLRKYTEGRVYQGCLPVLADDGAWHHPLLAETVDPRLRDDLRLLAAALPDLLDRLDAMPQALPHGDASPQNLLVPRADPDTIVAIDVSFQCPLAVGFDLGQLLVGLAHAGIVPAAALPDLDRLLVPAFLTGFTAEGGDIDADAVRFGYLGSLICRAGLSSLPLELLGAPVTDELAELFRQRAALTRFLVDLGLESLV